MEGPIREAIATLDGTARAEFEATFRFGDILICLRLHGHGQTAALLQSIQHRRIDAAPSAISIDVLGGPQARLERLLPPSGQRHQRYLYDDEHAYMYWAAEGNLTLLDRDAGRGIVWYVDPETIPSWEMGRPFLPLIKALSMATAWTPVHAAAVAQDHRSGILILGASNVGKSSTALVCVDAGWRYVGDDCVLLTAQPPRAASLYRTARVRADMFSSLQTAIRATQRFSVNSGEVRAEIDVGLFRGADIGDADIKAIVLPQRNGAERARLAPMSRSLALRALSATTLVMLPGARVATHNILADVVQAVPCYTVDPGPELSAVPAILAQLV